MERNFGRVKTATRPQFLRNGARSQKILRTASCAWKKSERKESGRQTARWGALTAENRRCLERTESKNYRLEFVEKKSRNFLSHQPKESDKNEGSYFQNKICTEVFEKPDFFQLFGKTKLFKENRAPYVSSKSSSDHFKLSPKYFCPKWRKLFPI